MRLGVGGITFVSVSAGRTRAKAYWWLQLLRVMAVAVIIVGVFAQPVVMLLVNVFWPHMIYDSLAGPVDPVSSSWFWVTALGPSVGALLFTAYKVWRAFLSDLNITWQELLLRWVIGVAVAFVLFPVMSMVTLLLPSFLR